MIKWNSSSADETTSRGCAFGTTLAPQSVVCFFGELGAGKTTFIKGLVAGATGVDAEQVSSPTFTYLNIYKGRKTVYHFDFYRLRDADEFLSMGFDDYLFADGICCIEWSEKIESILPGNCIKICLKHVDENSRVIELIRGE